MQNWIISSGEKWGNKSRLWLSCLAVWVFPAEINSKLKFLKDVVMHARLPKFTESTYIWNHTFLMLFLLIYSLPLTPLLLFSLSGPASIHQPPSAYQFTEITNPFFSWFLQSFLWHQACHRWNKCKWGRFINSTLLVMGFALAIRLILHPQRVLFELSKDVKCHI